MGIAQEERKLQEPDLKVMIVADRIKEIRMTIVTLSELIKEECKGGDLGNLEELREFKRLFEEDLRNLETRSPEEPWLTT